MIVPLSSRPDRAHLWPMIEGIFFQSTTASFPPDSPQGRAFLERWTGYYRESEPDNILLSLDPGERLAGYLTGCLDSRGARRLYRDIEWYAHFEDLYDDFPAHFHVNCHPDDRGRGIGSALVGAFLGVCADAGLGGVHIITSWNARNIGFYRKNGFDIAHRRRWRDYDLLFMGRARRLAPPPTT